MTDTTRKLTQDEFNKIVERHMMWRLAMKYTDAEPLGLFETGWNHRAVLIDEDLRGFDMSTLVLCDAVLIRCDLRGCDLRFADLRRAIICGSNLDGANLRGAVMCKAVVSDVSLVDADMRETHLKMSVFTNVKTQQTRFDEAVVDGLIGLDVINGKVVA